MSPHDAPALLTDDDLRAELALLEATTQAADTPEDDVTDAGYARLYALQAERDRRAGRCGLCGGAGPLAAGRTICRNCAFWPLD